MQRMHRKVGRILPRQAGDHEVEMLIADFNAADGMLEILIDATSHWRDSWTDVLRRQSAMIADYEKIYAHMTGASSGEYAETPQDKLERINALKTGYMELKDEMLQEIALIDKKIITPAKEALKSVKTYKKVIKKREDRKLDYERYRGRADKLETKTRRSERENNALAKHQTYVDSSTTAYEAADDQLKQTLPGMTHATYSILPHLLNAQIMIQNTLLAQLYTVLHGFAADFGFSPNPVETENIIRDFEADFTPLREEVESGMKSLASGKAVREPMGAQKAKSYSGMHIRDGISNKRSASSGATTTLGRIQSKPAQAAIEAPPSPSLSSPSSPPPVNGSNRPKIPGLRTTSSSLLSPNSLRPSPAVQEPQHDDFAAAPQNSSHSLTVVRRPSAISVASSASLSSIAGKKKPPPPPPPKKMLSQQFEYVTAVYDFPGSEDGDLPFREGDRIRILKKTGSSNDWWEGELRGVKGSFPANYCR